MTLPNKLTLGRIILIPVIVIIAYIPYLNNEIFAYSNVSIANIIMVSIFVIASLTDFLDGYLARKNNQVTTFGKFADPLADKLLVMAALIILMMQKVIPAWIVIVILSREFIVTGVRLVAVERGKVIAAGKLGKVKTATTMVALIVLFFHNTDPSSFTNPWSFANPVYLIGTILIYIGMILTVVSGIEYVWKNRGIIFESI